MIHTKWSFQPSFFLTFITLLLLAAFLGLSLWQYNKAQSKFETHRIQTALLDAHTTPNKTTKSSPPIMSFSQAINALDQFKQVSPQSNLALNDIAIRTSGTILPNWYICHDNRVKGWLAGYHILGIMLITPQSSDTSFNAVLINFGWTPLTDGRRDALPSNHLSLSTSVFENRAFENRVSENNAFEITQQQDVIQGTIEIPIPNTGAFSLNMEKNVETFYTQTNESKIYQWRAQKIDLQQIQILTQQTLPEPINLAPFVIRAKKAPVQFSQLSKEWLPIVSRGISAEKHLGYALQWLAFAILLVALYICLNLQKTYS